MDVTEVKVIVSSAPVSPAAMLSAASVTSITAAGRIIASLLAASFQLLSVSNSVSEVLFALPSFSLCLRHVSVFSVFNLDRITSDLFIFLPRSDRSTLSALVR